MNVADELRKLHELHESGALSDAEYETAKAKVLCHAGETPAERFGLSTGDPGRDANQWAMFIHLSQYAGFLIPLAGLVLPIVLWQIKKNDLPSVDAHGKVVVNWILSEIIYIVVFGVLSLLLIGIPFLAATFVLGLVFPAIGGIKAGNGELWRYPLSFRFLN